MLVYQRVYRQLVNVPVFVGSSKSWMCGRANQYITHFLRTDLMQPIYFFTASSLEAPNTCACSMCKQCACRHITYPQLLKGLKWYTQGSPEKGSRMVFFHIRPQPPDDLRPLNIDFYHISRNHNRPQKL